MSTTVAREDWQALRDVLDEAIKLLAGKQSEQIKRKILEFSSTAAMLGLEDLAGVAGRFEHFLVQTVSPQWNEEAVATLNFAMGALAEKMQMQEYGPNFSSGLNEVLVYLSFYPEEQPETAQIDSAGPETEADAPTPIPHRKPSDETIGHVIDTVDYYREILKIDPTSRINFILAEELCSRTLWKEAIEACSRGLAYHPQHLKGRILLGWALFETGEAEKAESVLMEARTDFEKNAILYRVLSRAAESRGDIAEANRLMGIYESIVSSGMSRSPEPEGTAERFEPALEVLPQEPPPMVTPEPLLQTFEAAAEEPEAKKKEGTPVLGLLSGLMDVFAKKPQAIPNEHTIFSDSDRKALKEILRTTVH